MKLTIKTLQQSTFKIDIEPDKTVKELKDKIEKDHGKDYPSGAQKLIYSGKILADDSKLAEYDIDEKKFIVLMITRQPPVQKAPTETAEKPPPAKKEEPTGAKPKEDTSKQAKPTNSTTNTNTATQSSSSSATATNASTTTTSAPTPTTPNTTTGQLSAAAMATANRPAARAPSAMSDVSALSGEPQMANRLASLMTQPHFRQIQDLIQQSPHLLSSTIEALAGSDPEMYSFITENPDIFVSALNHPPLARRQTARSSTVDALVRQATGQPATGRNPTGRQQPVVDQILGDVSEHDKEAIERLKELGFSEILVVQAYMACDKDEQLAANLLFQMDS